MQNRVQIALARRERLRRARDRAWMVLAGLAVAAGFGVIMLVARIGSGTPATPWVEIMLYGVLAIVTGFFAARAFGVARSLHRQLEDMNPMETPLADERPISVWDEVLRGRPRR